MASLNILLPVLMLTSAFVSSASSLERRADPAPASLPFAFQYAFTARLALGKPLPSVAIPGGVLVAEPIINGTVSGPAINATINAGIATPSIYNNGTLQVPVISAWGLTSDGFGFVINELGIGLPKGQTTRIQLSTGGGSRYEALRNGYILATVNPNANQTAVVVRVYLVSSTAVYS